MKKNYALYLFLTLVPSLIFNSCRKQEMRSNSDKLLLLDNENTLFIKWAQANSGRWLPYSIRNAKDKKENASSIDILTACAVEMRYVNAAKTYYRYFLKMKLVLLMKHLVNTWIAYMLGNTTLLIKV